jgi:hypothetical protein
LPCAAAASCWIKSASGQLQVYFIYGVGLSVTGGNGTIETMRRPGFVSTVPGPGAAPSSLQPAPPGQLAQLLTTLDGRPGGTGRTSRVPTGSVAINTFDGRSVSGAVVGSGNIYGGTIAGPNAIGGQILGRFYGPNALETGGSFAFRSTTGAPYSAAGIFYGK